MRYTHTQQGIGMIETLLVLVLFTGLAAMVGVMSVRLKDDARSELDRVQAVSLAEEGLVALNTLREHDMDFLSEGEYGLYLENGMWSLVGSPDTFGKFTRTLSIEKMEGDIVRATSSVVWEGLRSGSVVLPVVLSDMYETYGVSQYVEVDAGVVGWDGTGTELSGIFITNTDTQPHTITALASTWSGGVLLQEVTFGSTSVFSVATSSAVTTGTHISINAAELGPGETVELTLLFLESGHGQRNTLQLELEDGSVRNSFFMTE